MIRPYEVMTETIGSLNHVTSTLRTRSQEAMERGENTTAAELDAVRSLVWAVVHVIEDEDESAADLRELAQTLNDRFLKRAEGLALTEGQKMADEFGRFGPAMWGQG